MQPITRKTHILKIIARSGQISVNDLSNELNVCVETIRRDLNFLEQKGELVRVHGGAMSKLYKDEGTSFNNRASSNISDKKFLVDKVISNIYEGSVIGLDASSSSWLVAQAIPNIKCTIVTNSINNINVLFGKNNISIISLGGYYSDKYKAFYGLIARNALAQLSLDLSVISCMGFDESSGVWDSNEYTYEIKKMFIEVSEKVILLADKSKYKKKGLFKICDFNEIDKVISNVSV